MEPEEVSEGAVRFPKEAATAAPDRSMGVGDNGGEVDEIGGCIEDKLKRAKPSDDSSESIELSTCEGVATGNRKHSSLSSKSVSADRPRPFVTVPTCSRFGLLPIESVALLASANSFRITESGVPTSSTILAIALVVLALPTSSRGGMGGVTYANGEATRTLSSSSTRASSNVPEIESFQELLIFHTVQPSDVPFTFSTAVGHKESCIFGR